MLELTSEGSIKSSARNDELKEEFKVFYDNYQREEAEVTAKIAEYDEKIAVFKISKNNNTFYILLFLLFIKGF